MWPFLFPWLHNSWRWIIPFRSSGFLTTSWVLGMDCNHSILPAAPRPRPNPGGPSASVSSPLRELSLAQTPDLKQSLSVLSELSAFGWSTITEYSLGKKSVNWKLKRMSKEEYSSGRRSLELPYGRHFLLSLTAWWVRCPSRPSGLSPGSCLSSGYSSQCPLSAEIVPFGTTSCMVTRIRGEKACPHQN